MRRGGSLDPQLDLPPIRGRWRSGGEEWRLVGVRGFSRKPMLSTHSRIKNFEQPSCRHLQVKELESVMTALNQIGAKLGIHGDLEHRFGQRDRFPRIDQIAGIS